MQCPCARHVVVLPWAFETITEGEMSLTPNSTSAPRVSELLELISPSLHYIGLEFLMIWPDVIAMCIIFMKRTVNVSTSCSVLRK